MAWQLRSDGWSPDLPTFERDYTGFGLADGTPYTAVDVTVEGSRVTSVSTSRCQIGAPYCAGPD